MTGVSERAFWEQDGMYLSQIAGEDITLGKVVEIGNTDGYVVVASSASTQPLGVAIAGYRTSRTATDNEVASGNLVTVATRGVVNLTVADGTVTRGELVYTYGTEGGIASGGTQPVIQRVLGLALSTGTQVVKVKLMRG